jgi:hypothetical protein
MRCISPMGGTISCAVSDILLCFVRLSRLRRERLRFLSLDRLPRPPTARSLNSPGRGAGREWPNSKAGRKKACGAKAITDTGGPHKLGISIRCANASAKVELRASLVDSGGAISGTWEERTYNQSGSVTGHATANRLSLSISGGITGSMIVTVSHKSHSVAVITSGPSLKGINISMSR